jgi:hypothetical protein
MPKLQRSSNSSSKKQMGTRDSLWRLEFLWGLVLGAFRCVKHTVNAQSNISELVRAFNEDEAVQRCFERKRARRRLRQPQSAEAEELLDQIDWLAAERECRLVRAVGRVA